MPWLVFFLSLLCCSALEITEALRVVGTWKSDDRPVQILAKFGFQQVDPLDAEHTRGFVYGNVSSRSDSGARGVLVIVPRTHIAAFLDESAQKQHSSSCGALLQNMSLLAFDAKCFPKGKGDVMRWIPCAQGKLCAEEDTPEKVIAGSQMTLRIEEPSVPQYWYVVLVACYLDDQCVWKPSVDEVIVQYDLWLTNGSPLMRYLNPFGHQFSFEEQNSAEMYILFLVLYLILAFCQWRSVTMCSQATTLPRHQLLNAVIALKVTEDDKDSQGILIARLVGETARLLSICLLCLLLVLLSCGWSFSTDSELSTYFPTLILWALLTVAHFVLFFMNFVSYLASFNEILFNILGKTHLE
ncbi:unnamed protein product [Gongylonema pulchrum]|uniref:GpcrRhopsn4 domain-containing protein n=1 Tax=Gongylonema pulchrum TaxID=637853 RepID=A0A183ED72_9BILA|nr:unnamed protein product [Gongylonema pulchrum]